MTGTLRFARRPAIAKAVALVAVALLGASAAGAATVFYLSQTVSPAAGISSLSAAATSSSGAPLAPATSSSSSSSTTSTSTTSLVNALSSTVSLGSSSTSSIPCLLNGTGLADATQLNATIGALAGNLTAALNEGPGNATVPELFGTFSQVTITSDLSGPVGLATTSSYQVVGRPVIDSLEYYEVNITTTALGFNDSEVVMFAPNGTATSVSSPLLGNFTGASAETMGDADVSPFLIQLHSGAYASSIESDPTIAVLNSTTLYLGPTQVNMTYYTLKSAPLTYCGTTLNEVVEGLGTVQGTGLTMVLYTQVQVTDQGTTVGETTSVASLTLASP